VISYNMRPDDAWALPYDEFIWLSDVMEKRLTES
jgi:hypothetical protein